MSDVEIFTPTGVICGETARVPLTNDGPDLVRPLAVADARWYPLDGSAPEHRGDATIGPDDILLIVTPAPDMHVHMVWYAVALELGPYRVSGQLATHPGFDPEKALARPGSTFIALTEATVELLEQGDAGAAERAYLHVNRYAVERVTSTLMLGHFFPGARLVAQEAAAAAAHEAEAAAALVAPPVAAQLVAPLVAPMATARRSSSLPVPASNRLGEPVPVA